MQPGEARRGGLTQRAVGGVGDAARGMGTRRCESEQKKQKKIKKDRTSLPPQLGRRQVLRPQHRDKSVIAARRGHSGQGV